MRAELWAMTVLLIVPVAAQQRGVVSGVAVLRAPAQAGVPVEITVTGRNPCGAVRIDPGDGTERITHAITQVPTTVRYVYRKAGRFEVRAEGMWATATAWRRPAFRSIPRPSRRRQPLPRQPFQLPAACATWTPIATAS